MSHPLKKEVLKCKKRISLANSNYFDTKKWVTLWPRKCMHALDVFVRKKKAMGVWSSEVKCIKWKEKSEVFQKLL